jgi:hypothetical protein
MSYYTDLMRELSTLCLAMTLGDAEKFVQAIDASRLALVERVNLMSEAAARIGGCSRYEPARAAAAAARLTEQARATYDHTSGEQTLLVIKLVTRYLRYHPSDFREGTVTEGLTNTLKKWVEVWIRAEAAVDPDWSPTEEFPPFETDRRGQSLDGQAPESIADPVLRAAYIEYLDRQAVFRQRMRNQTLLRRALDEARDDYISYATELKKTPAMNTSLRDAAAAVADPAVKMALAR